MSNVIQFLESMGANAAMARMSFVEYQAAIDTLNVDTDSARALSLRDHVGLRDLLDVRPQMLCMVMAPDQESETQDQPDEHEAPAEDSPESSE
ncbi:MAG: hypothetical protein ABL934_13370 [Lysobacteraceae bacterium]